MGIHDDLVEEVEDCIDKVFSDMTVDQCVTRESLEGLIGYITVIINTLDNP